MAAKLGAEVFAPDAGRYNKRDWSPELGDYRADPVAFPNGLAELANHVRGLGMKFGIWVEIENAGVDSELARMHPDWFLRRNGEPITTGARRHLNFALPAVRKWARGVVDGLVRDAGIEWIKIDYNIDIGDSFDPHGPGCAT